MFTRTPIRRSLFLTLLLLPLLALSLPAQSGAGASVNGTIVDSTGAPIPGATITLSPVAATATAQDRTATSGPDGHYVFSNIPEHAYRITATATNFASATKTVTLRAGLPLTQDILLTVASVADSVTVEASGSMAIEPDPSAHTDIEIEQIQRTLEAPASQGLSVIITNASPGVSADSNGMFHPLGEHSDTTFSIDGQPISDQQSRVFSNQLSTTAIASVEVLDGVIPPEYGDKASLVARTTTRSGLNTSGIRGSLGAGYGSFGTSTLDASLAAGNKKIGDFLALNLFNTGRFLDPPESHPLHDHGNNEAIFNRFDYVPTSVDTFQLNLSASRSWFQQPNQVDQNYASSVTPIIGTPPPPHGPQDQRQQNKSFNVSPMYTRTLNDHTVLNTGIYVRQDRIGYYPSANPFSDTPATLSQTRRLTNAGIKADLSYVRGIHSFKFGGNFNHTFLSEKFATALTVAGFNSPCLFPQNGPGQSNPNAGTPVPDPKLTDRSQCAARKFDENLDFAPGLVAYDLTRGGHLFNFQGRTDIKQEALYAEDNINLGHWSFLVGGRADNYNGLSSRSMFQPRLGATYHLTRTGTVFRAAYSKLFPTPYNENLILSSSTGAGGLAASAGAQGQTALKPGKRNQYNVGFEQSLGKYAVASTDFFWKYTDRDFDFDTLFSTPLTFPIQWAKSKIDGFDARLTVRPIHGIQGYTVVGHTKARFFGPESGGLIFNSPLNTGAFRIDHDEGFEASTNIQYQPKKNGPWTSLLWRFDSGAVAGSLDSYQTALGLTPDQQAQIQLYCGSRVATIDNPIRRCDTPNRGANLVRIPADGTYDPDKNPARIAPRNLFDATIGWDDALHHLMPNDRVKTNISFTATNLTNKMALYNFLSTFSGTHFVSPRALTANLTFTF